MEHLLPQKLSMLRRKYKTVSRDYLAIDNLLASIINLNEDIKRIDISLEVLEAKELYKIELQRDLNLLGACLHNTCNILEKIKENDQL